MGISLVALVPCHITFVIAEIKLDIVNVSGSVGHHKRNGERKHTHGHTYNVEQYLFANFYCLAYKAALGYGVL